MLDCTVTQLICLFVVLVIYYFFIKYKFNCMVDKKLHRYQKKLLRKISALYKYFNNNDTQEQRRLSEMAAMREQQQHQHQQEMMNRRRYAQQPPIEDSEEDSVQDVGGMQNMNNGMNGGMNDSMDNVEGYE